MPDNKDEMRIYDIIIKAKWNPTKMLKLAETMCKLITHAEKAFNRFQVAKRILGENDAVTLEFKSKFESLK